MQMMLSRSTTHCTWCAPQVPDANDKRYQPGPPAEGEEEAVRLEGSQVCKHSTAVWLRCRCLPNTSGTEGLLMRRAAVLLTMPRTVASGVLLWRAAQAGVAAGAVGVENTQRERSGSLASQPAPGGDVPGEASCSVHAAQ